MEEICTFAKRGWLVKDSKEETVANLDFLTTSFSGLKGGDEAVKKCMKVKEEAESLDDYYYYDYDYYFDDYDYMEEAEGIEVRRKREAGKNDGKKSRQKKRKEKRRSSKKGKGRNAGKKPNQKKRNGKKGKNNQRAKKKGSKRNNGKKNPKKKIKEQKQRARAK